MASYDDAERLSQLVRARRDLMAAILKQSMACEAAVEAGLVESLITALAEKDQQVEQLKRLQAELQPHAEVAAESRSWPSEEMREQCRREIEQTAQLQAAILEIDARCEATMTLRRDELFNTLQQTTGSALAARAYATQTAHSLPTRPSFDLTSD